MDLLLYRFQQIQMQFFLCCSFSWKLLLQRDPFFFGRCSSSCNHTKGFEKFSFAHSNTLLQRFRNFTYLTTASVSTSFSKAGKIYETCSINWILQFRHRLFVLHLRSWLGYCFICQCTRFRIIPIRPLPWI